MLKRILIAAVLLPSTVYVCDDFSVRFRIPRNRDPLGSVRIQPYYAIRQKNGKTEFDFNVAPESQTCVQSLFPHLGYSPCWYVNRNKTKRIDI